MFSGLEIGNIGLMPDNSVTGQWNQVTEAGGQLSADPTNIRGPKTLLRLWRCWRHGKLSLV